MSFVYGHCSQTEKKCFKTPLVRMAKLSWLAENVTELAAAVMPITYYIPTPPNWKSYTEFSIYSNDSHFDISRMCQRPKQISTNE